MRRLMLSSCLAVCALLVAGCGGGAAGAESEVAFVSTADDDYAIYGMRADGSGQGRLSPKQDVELDSPVDVFFQYEPDWSPDGKQIAFTSRRDRRAHVYAMAADGAGTEQLTSGDHDDTGPAWSPDGKRIAFARDAKLTSMSSTGGDIRPVTTNVGGEEAEPAWSPDGKWLAFRRRLPGFTSREIWVVRADGTGQRQVTKLNAASYGPAWSPDGKRIVFSSNANDDRYQLYEIGMDGKGLRRLTFQLGEYFDPSWSADGKTLIFERDGVVYTLVGGGETALTDGPNDGSPAWRPDAP